MPLVDGVKMACASCIRGHRSQKCEHHDRPLLKLRRKGRPSSYPCDICHDLRKALGIRARCICEPNVEEAPKRKAIKKKEIEKEQAPRNGMTDGLSTSGSSGTTSITHHQPPIIITSALEGAPHLPVPQGSSSAPPDTSNPACCPSVVNVNESSQTVGMQNTTFPVRITNSPCCTRPVASSSNGQGNGVVVESTQLIDPANQVGDPAQYPSQTQPYRYTPYLPVVQSSYGVPTTLSEISENVQPVDSGPTFDSEALALWDQLLGEDMTNTFEGLIDEASSVPYLSEPSKPSSYCESCPPGTPCCVAPPANVPGDSACCDGFDCSDLAACLVYIGKQFPVVGDNYSLALASLPQPNHQSSFEPMDPDYSQAFSILDSSAPEANFEELGFNSAFPVAAPCSCDGNCICPVCDLRVVDALASGDLCTFCVTCLLCIETNVTSQGGAPPRLTF